jgi:hypothetical protein
VLAKGVAEESAAQALRGRLLVMVYDYGDPALRATTENIWHAQQAGWSGVLERTAPGTAKEWRKTTLRGIPKILTRDEFPFASTRAVDFGTGEVLKDALPWVGHVPWSEAVAQRNMIGQFYSRFRIGEGDRFLVKVVNFPGK